MTELVPDNRQKVRFSCVFRFACARPRLQPPDVWLPGPLLQQACEPPMITATSRALCGAPQSTGRHQWRLGKKRSSGAQTAAAA